MSKFKQIYAEFRSQQMRQEWIDRVKRLAASVDHPQGQIGPEALWATDEARRLYEMALQWHAYNAGATDVRKKHRAIHEQR